jgi:hypothetical protein
MLPAPGWATTQVDPEVIFGLDRRAEVESLHFISSLKQRMSFDEDGPDSDRPPTHG